MVLKAIRGFESHTLRLCPFRRRVQCVLRPTPLFYFPLLSMRLSKRFFVRFALLAAAVPCVWYGSASAAYYLHKRHTVIPSLSKLAPADAPNAGTRLLVFAPHCDDETLGCAGLIQQTLAAGGTVKIVFLTNGDGFRLAVQRFTRTVTIEARDHIQFAQLRQTESYQALEHLGVKKEDIVFLGYPDRGLMPIWQSYWTPDKPYTSSFTLSHASPYPITYNSKAVYCGQDICADIRRVVTQFQPTLVTVTHPLDDHPDHAAASAFVTHVCRTLAHDPAQTPLLRNLRLEYYLVHRGEWPVPMGDHPTEPLVPPAEMMATETKWNRFALTMPQTQTKAEAIDLYASQTAIMGRYLSSFARSNEMLGTVPETTLSAAPVGFSTLDGDAQKWKPLLPVCLNPINDSVIRDLQSGGDFRAVYACRNAATLFLRFDTRQAVAPRMVFKVQVRFFDREGGSGREAFQCSLSPSDVSHLPNGVKAAVSGKTVELAIPVSALTSGQNWSAIGSLAISADTAYSGLEVDKTGVSFLSVPDEGRQ